MSPSLRKLIGSLLIAAWLITYVAVAAVIGDRVLGGGWLGKLLFFPIAGIGWVVPVKPLIGWAHAKDGPKQSPDV